MTWTKSLSRHDESHESKKRVMRDMMNRMNRKKESHESWWIAWIDKKSLSSHHESHESKKWVDQVLIFESFWRTFATFFLSWWIHQLKKNVSFMFLSIWKGNCGADIINRTMKCKTFVGKCCKKGRWVDLYFPTKFVFLQVLKH